MTCRFCAAGSFSYSLKTMVFELPNAMDDWGPIDSVALLQALFVQSLDSILVCTTDSKVLLANPAAQALLGYGPRELQAMNLADLDMGGSNEVAIGNLISRMKQDESAEVLGVWATQSGDPIPVRVRISFIQFHTQQCFLVIARDISKLRKQEDELRQNSKMQAIGQLAGGIAHDFNNALGGIMGYAELAIEDAGQNDVQRDNLEKLLQAAERAKKLVNQILTFSRKSTARKDVVQMGPLLEESMAFLRSSIPSSIVIETDIPARVPPVAGDPSTIYEMIINLATNAVHAMGETGILKLSLRQMHAENPVSGVIGEVPPGDYAVIEMTDTGCGIDPSLIHLIFEPFFSTKLPDEGTGMGLSVVFGVVRSHNGNLRIASSVGEGTTVWVYLPVVHMKTVSSPAPYAAPLGGSETILVVDDEPLLVDICGKLLESLGYKAITTMDVNEALDYLQDPQLCIDVMLTDQTMPQMRGTELASRAMKLRPGLPVILCTGYSNSVDEDEAERLGISRFIQKPVRKKELARSIRDALVPR